MKKHLLIVEDENLIQFSLLNALQSGSVQVTSATNGTEALRKFAASPDYDLYIIDLSLPDMGGEELLLRIRTDQPLAKCIILTGKYLSKEGMLDIMEGASALEPFYFVTKPFNIQEIQEVVFRALLS